MEPRVFIQEETATFTSGQLPIEPFTFELRNEAQAALALPTEQFNELSFIREADLHANFYIETPAAYEQDEERVMNILNAAYATPAQLLSSRTMHMTPEETMYDFLVRIEEVKLAYEVAYNEAEEDARREIVQAAKAQGIYFVDGEAVFRYDKFEDFYASDLKRFGFIQGFIAMAQFDDTLYEVDDLRYAPENIFRHFRELTMALLTVDYTPLNDVYESQFILMVLRMLQGTEKYPLTESSITEFLAHDAGVFTPIAKTILAELQQSGTSQTAASLTYDELLRTFQTARVPYSSSISSEQYWESTEEEVARLQAQWQRVPDNVLNLSGQDVVLYYLHALETNEQQVLMMFHNERTFDAQQVALSNVQHIQFTMYGDGAVVADVSLPRHETVRMTFMKVNDVWQRMQ
ncbi:MAG: hypothetical protein UHX00_01895, partial [Caryophanon sp.]|nr:hypothetical protein [Caryophanon sp.]